MCGLWSKSIFGHAPLSARGPNKALETKCILPIIIFNFTAGAPDTTEEDRLMDHRDEGMTTLTSLASERGFIVRDVARDGDCLFHAIQQQLQKLGVEVHKDALRQQLAAYLEDHPYTHDGSCHLRDFLSQAIQSNDTLNADTEQPTEEDERI